VNRSVFLLILCVIVGSGCRSTRPPETAVGPRFHILTYNVNWGGPRPDLAAEVIRASGADIVCLQETTPEWEQFLRRALSKEYSYAEFRQSKHRAGGGLAFLSKTPGTEVAYVPSNTGWFDGWITKFETAVGPVQILNVHLHPPFSERGSVVSGYLTTHGDRLREMQRFYSLRKADLPILIAGDFNDVENSPVLKWLKTQDMANSLPQFDRSTATWQWKYGPITLKRRMDHIFYSPELNCCSADVIRAGASDHFPVEAVFTRGKAATMGKGNSYATASQQAELDSKGDPALGQEAQR